MEKKGGLIVLGIFLLVFSVVLVNAGIAQGDTCYVTSRGSCSESASNNILLGLSSETNAHAELKNENDENLCKGTATPCDSFNTQYACESQAGCSFTAAGGSGGGTGTANAILPGNAILGSCSGTATACSALNNATNQQACEAQRGCSYEVEYDYVLCCNFGNGFQPNECNTQRSIISFSSEINAHVEDADLGNYVHTSCYGDLDSACQVLATGTADSGAASAVLGLYSDTNTHVGAPDPTLPYQLYCPVIYNNSHLGTYCGDGAVQSIYTASGPNDQGLNEECEIGDEGCTAQCSCDVENDWEYDVDSNICIPIFTGGTTPYWLNPEDSNAPTNAPNWLGEVSGEKTFIVGETVVWAALSSSGYNEGEQVSFDIYENDFIGDDYIKTITGTVDAEGDVAAYWIISQTDVENAGNENNWRFYFRVSDSGANEYTSNDMEAVLGERVPCETISMCRDYRTEDHCINDIIYCDVAEYNVLQVNPNVDCSIEGSCVCSWNVSAESCNPLWRYTYNGVGVGSCNTQDTTSDTCQDDNFLTYSWTASWSWDEDNSYDNLAACESDFEVNGCIEEPSGTWRGDPENKRAECADGSNVVPCPARIPLNFFNTYNLIGAAIIIAIIYWLLNSKKKGAKKKTRKKVKRKRR